MNNTNSLGSRVLCVGLHCHCLGTSLVDKEETREVTRKKQAAQGAYKVTKTRLKAVVDPFASNHRRCRAAVRDVTLPGLTSDLRLTPVNRLDPIRALVAEYQAEDRRLLEDLTAPFPTPSPEGYRSKYEAAVEADRNFLGSGFDQSLYPPIEMLPQHFSIDLFTCDLPHGDYDRILGLTDEAREQMRREHEALMVQIGAQARNEVMRKLTGLIQKVAEKLSNPDVERFHEATFDNLREYLDQVPELNVTNDPILEQLRLEAREKLNLSMAAVKESAALKERAAEDARAILSRFGAVGKRKLLTDES